MSAKTSRPRVQSVNSAASSQTGAGGALLAAILVGGAVKLLSAATRAVLEQSRPVLPSEALKTIEPLSAVRAKRAQLQQDTRLTETLSAVEAAKASTLATLSAASYRITSETTLKDQLASLCQAGSVAEVHRIEQQVITLLESEHQAVMTSALRLSCINAAVKIGFSTIQTLPGPLGTIRLVATNAAGQNLITEISSDDAGHSSIETEVVGVSDGSCDQILNDFDKRLETEGVRSNPPARTFTGGVCELAAAREFVRSQVRPPQASAAPVAAAAEDSRRAQRLNTSSIINQR